MVIFRDNKLKLTEMVFAIVMRAIFLLRKFKRIHKQTMKLGEVLRNTQQVKQ